MLLYAIELTNLKKQVVIMLNKKVHRAKNIVQKEIDEIEAQIKQKLVYNNDKLEKLYDELEQIQELELARNTIAFADTQRVCGKFELAEMYYNKAEELLRKHVA